MWHLQITEQKTVMAQPVVLTPYAIPSFFVYAPLEGEV
jgi:hypothetical protein